MMQELKMKELQEFIDSLLVVNKKVSYNATTFKETLTIINSIPLKQQKQLAEAIKKMEYADFITTPYWKLLAQHIKVKAKHRCRVCNSNDVLHIHHRTYDHHGYEYQNFETELICLCGNCHGIFHKEVDG
jgi:hypothetical protein